MKPLCSWRGLRLALTLLAALAPRCAPPVGLSAELTGTPDAGLDAKNTPVPTQPTTDSASEAPQQSPVTPDGEPLADAGPDGSGPSSDAAAPTDSGNDA